MKNYKVVLDRKPIASEQIKSRENFGKLLDEYRSINTFHGKKGWYYGGIGIASVTALLAVNNIDSNVSHYKPEKLSKAEFVPFPKFVELDFNRKEQIVSVANGTRKTKKVIDRPEQKTSLSEIDRSEKRVSIGQVVENQELKNTVLKPTIAGIYEGALQMSQLLKSPRIEVASDIKVIQFKISYESKMYDEVATIQGDVIPERILSEIKNFSGGQAISISNVYGRKLDGEQILLPSMDIFIVN